MVLYYTVYCNLMVFITKWRGRERWRGEREREGRGEGCEILTFNLLNCYFLFLYAFFY